MTEKNKIEKSEEIKETPEESGQVQEQDLEKQGLEDQLQELHRELQKKDLLIDLLCEEMTREQ